jgi:hypothetical protein
MLSKAISNVFKRSPSLLNYSSRAFASGTEFVKFDYLDPFNIEELLTEDEKMMRDLARKYA